MVKSCEAQSEDGTSVFSLKGDSARRVAKAAVRAEKQSEGEDGPISSEAVEAAAAEAGLSEEETAEVYVKLAEKGICVEEPKEAEYEGGYCEDGTRQYLSEIGRIKLLSYEEEQKLGKQVKEGTEEERKEAINALVSHNLKLSASIAGKYTMRGLPYLDLMMEGNFGLFRAASRFDYTKHLRFATYATCWVKQAVIRSLANQARTIRISVHTTEILGKIHKATKALTQSLGRMPTDEEIACEMGGRYTAAKVAQLKSYVTPPVSLDGQSYRGSAQFDRDEDDFASRVADKASDSPEKAADRTLLSEEVANMLMTLAPDEREAVKLTYGINEMQEQMTPEQIAARTGRTAAEVKASLKKAMAKLRHPSRSKKLKPYLPEADD